MEGMLLLCNCMSTSVRFISIRVYVCLDWLWSTKLKKYFVRLLCCLALGACRVVCLEKFRLMCQFCVLLTGCLNKKYACVCVWAGHSSNRNDLFTIYNLALFYSEHSTHWSLIIWLTCANEFNWSWWKRYACCILFWHLKNVSDDERVRNGMLWWWGDWLKNLKNFFYRFFFSIHRCLSVK